MANLKELLKELDDPNPISVDPDDEELGITSAHIIYKNDHQKEKYEGSTHAQFGNLRVRTAATRLADDPKYAGKKVSRDDLFSDSDRDLNPADQSDVDGESSEDDHKEILDSYDELYDEPENLADESDDDQVFGGRSNHSYSDYEENISSKFAEESQAQESTHEIEYESAAKFPEDRRAEDLAKGKAAKCQLEIWDKFLEHRIRLQKAVVLSNRLPQHDRVWDFKVSDGPHLIEALGSTRSSLVMLLGKLLDLQKTLFEMNPETKSILGYEKKPALEDDDEDISSGPDEEEAMSDEETSRSKENNDADTLRLPSKRKHTLTLPEYEEEISKRHKAFNSYRDSTITKWYDKTRLSSGKLHSKSFSSFDKSVLTQVKQILADKDRLIKRTQLKRSIYRVLGKPYTSKSVPGKPGKVDADSHLKDYDTEIFDDDDFYHQLLKELIERKSNISASDDPVRMGRQWLELQKLRIKVKRKIDTKASKGRRIRYNVHPKLVSFMAPVKAGDMSDQIRNDLFSSLFGKTNYQPLR